MKFYLTFFCPEPVVLPVSYNHILQAAILAWLQDEEYTRFLHDEGYQRERRTFKLYAFSRLIGKHSYDKAAQKLVFTETVSLCISSYVDDMEEYVKKSLQRKRPLRLGKVFLPVKEAFYALEEYSDCVVDAVSPITIHSTVELPTGTKKTYYYEAGEKDFSKMLRDNLVRKYMAIHNHEPEEDSFRLEPLDTDKVRKEIVRYRDTVIIGWSGRFCMGGSPELLKMALLAGAGARNSMGFGCLLQLKKGMS